MKMTSPFIVLLSLFILFSSCDSGTNVETPASGEAQAEVDAVIRAADDFDDLVTTGRILTRVSVSDRNGMRSSISRAKAALQALSYNSSDKNALRVLKNALLDMSVVVADERDAPRMNGLTVKIKSLYIYFAGIQGIDASEVQFKLYSFNMAAGVEPFGIFAVDGLAWRVGESLDRYYIKASARDAHAWLISPRFDFTNVKNPGFRLRHLFQINENNKADSFDLQTIKREAFQILISETFEKGDPTSINKREWKRIDIGKLPSGIDFHTLDTGAISLKEYEGKKVTIAFVFNAGRVFGGHYLTWQIDRFEITGSSAGFKYEKYDEDKPFWRWSVKELKDASLDRFIQKTASGEPGNFGVSDHNGAYYVRISRKDGTGVKNLYTEAYDFTSLKKPVVILSHSSKFYAPENHGRKLLQIFAAKEVEGTSVENLDWINLNLDTSNVGGSYTVVKSNEMEIPSFFKDGPVKFSLRWEGQGEGLAPLWDIHALSVKDLEGE